MRVEERWPRRTTIGSQAALRVGVAALATWLLTASAVRAEPQQDTKAACLKAYEDSQVHRRAEELMSARQELRTCASEACPTVVRTDCVQWLSEVDEAIPSLVFDARTDDGPVFDVTVRAEGHVVAAALDGHPVELDPGLHTFSFERAGAKPLEQKVILREGEKSRLLLADWSMPKTERPLAADAAPSVVMYRPVPATAIVSLSAGVLGFVDFGVFALLGNAKKQELDGAHCAPFCTADQVSAVRTPYLAADIGLAVGIAGVVTGGVLLLTRPARPRETPAASGVFVLPTSTRSAGGLVGWRGVF